VRLGFPVASILIQLLTLLDVRPQPDEYRGILHALWRIISEEGFFELYRGLAPSIIGVIPYAGVNYFTYDSLRTLYKRVSKEERIGNIQTLLIGSLAGAIASSSTFPLEVARKQMQVGNFFPKTVLVSRDIQAIDESIPEGPRICGFKMTNLIDHIVKNIIQTVLNLISQVVQKTF